MGDNLSPQVIPSLLLLLVEVLIISFYHLKLSGPFVVDDLPPKFTGKINVQATVDNRNLFPQVIRSLDLAEVLTLPFYHL